MGRLKNLKNLLALPIFIILLSSCSPLQQDAKIRIIDAKMASGVDDKYAPIDVRTTFPQGTTKVFCWFSWRDARKDIQVMAKWKYITDDIHILDYAFTIPRKEGQGSVSFSMPEGKVLPAGLYQLNLELDNKQLKTLTFKVQ